MHVSSAWRHFDSMASILDSPFDSRASIIIEQQVWVTWNVAPDPQDGDSSFDFEVCGREAAQEHQSVVLERLLMQASDAEQRMEPAPDCIFLIWTLEGS